MHVYAHPTTNLEKVQHCKELLERHRETIQHLEY